MQARTGAVWECVWYRAPLGFELRVQHASHTHDIVALKTFAAICEEMQECSAEWRRMALARGFHDVWP